MSAGYPLLLDVDGRAVLVVGAGPVSARRAIGLADAGALVTVVAPAADALAIISRDSANRPIWRNAVALAAQSNDSFEDPLT